MTIRKRLNSQIRSVIPLSNLNKIELGKAIKKVRTMRKISQHALEKECYLSKGYMSALESDYNHPTVDSLLIICDKLNVSIVEMLLIALIEASVTNENLNQLLSDVRYEFIKHLNNK